jgi:formylglycine-generating enzyme required for sulfatase activity
VHGHNGGVWEWTDTPFDGYEGFVPSVIYPGYSADFFDGKHFVVVSDPRSDSSDSFLGYDTVDSGLTDLSQLGGSYATIPTIAGRKSFRNWYQSNYRFSFIGGRVAYDV